MDVSIYTGTKIQSHVTVAICNYYWQ